MRVVNPSVTSNFARSSITATVEKERAATLENLYCL